jgi:hypothetical protein
MEKNKLSFGKLFAIAIIVYVLFAMFNNKI